MIMEIREGAYIAIDKRVLPEEYRRHTPLVWLIQHQGQILVKNLAWCRGDQYPVPDDFAEWTEDGGVLHFPEGDIEFRWATRERLLAPDVESAIDLEEGLLALVPDATEESVEALLASPDDALNAACYHLCYSGGGGY